MAGKSKVFRNKTPIVQIVYDKQGNKIEIVPGATVSGDPDHYIAKYGHVLEEVKVEEKKPANPAGSSGGNSGGGNGGEGGGK